MIPQRESGTDSDAMSSSYILRWDVVPGNEVPGMKFYLPRTIMAGRYVRSVFGENSYIGD